MDLALNNLQWLICHKTKLNQTKPKTEGVAITTDYVTSLWVFDSILKGDNINYIMAAEI